MTKNKFCKIEYIRGEKFEIHKCPISKQEPF